VGDGYYKLVAKHSGKVLDVAGISSANGAKLHQWDYVGGDNQKWKL
jgi:elongation factor Tu